MSGPQSHPTFIETPEPPSAPDTPSDMPGTPNSTMTSLSALSTTAIKDGRPGVPHASSTHPLAHHSHQPSLNTLEAERADRISRLAGLERVSTLRQPQFTNTPGGTATPQAGAHNQSSPAQQPGYFDAMGNPIYAPKMSTVGSASATGSAGVPDSEVEARSVGGRTTTWASSEGMADDVDMISRDREQELERERDRFSDAEDGMSDEGNASLVAFGEGAGSTVSGPTYTRSRPGLRSEGSVGSAAGVGARGSLGTEAAERIVRERLDDGEGRRPALGTPEEAGLGKFYFEGKK